MVFCGFYRSLKSGVLLSEHGGLNDNHLTDSVGDGFRYETHIVTQLLGVVFVLKPAANKHMVLDVEQQGMKPNTFQAGSHEYRQVDTGALFLTEHLFSCTDTLSGVLKTLGWRDVDEPLVVKCLIYCCHHLPHTVGVLGLIVVQCRTARQPFQNAGGVEVDLGEARGIGGDEG